MAKYENTHYYQAPRIFWPRSVVKFYDKIKHINIYSPKYADDKYLKFHALSVNAKWLYQTLKEMEHRYTGIKNNTYTVIFEGVANTKNWFYAGTDKITYMAGMSKSSVRRARKELVNAGLIKMCIVSFLRDGKKTNRHTYGYYVFGETELAWQEIEEDENDDDFE